MAVSSRGLGRGDPSLCLSSPSGAAAASQIGNHSVRLTGHPVHTSPTPRGFIRAGRCSQGSAGRVACPVGASVCGDGTDGLLGCLLFLVSGYL